MHYLHSLVCKLVGLDNAFTCGGLAPWTRIKIHLHTVPTDHLHDETTLSFIRLILDVALAPFHCGIFIPHIADTTLEYGQQCLPLINASIEPV